MDTLNIETEEDNKKEKEETKTGKIVEASCRLIPSKGFFKISSLIGILLDSATVKKG